MGHCKFLQPVNKANEVMATDPIAPPGPVA